MAIIMKYREALERAEKIHKFSSDLSEIKLIEQIFPELAESEDERIRKALVRFHKSTIDIDGIKGADIVAWLEKQSQVKESPISQHYNKTCKENDNSLTSGDERIRKALLEYFGEQCDMSDWNGIYGYEVVAWLEKQGETSPILSNSSNIGKDEQKPSWSEEDKGEISDGYHTFNELYYYRMLYNAAFFNLLPKDWVHKSKKHHDGEECFGGGWFIVMAELPTGQISNHYELKDWDLFQIPEKEVADEWDGHTPQEAAERLHKYLQSKITFKQVKL